MHYAAEVETTVIAMSRYWSALSVAVVALMVPPGAPAQADHQPTLVVPGKPGVPVVIDGREASWAVVEGDWGLYRPGHGTRTVVPGSHIISVPAAGGYYPATGRQPRYGRYEIEPPPNRQLPPPAETYYRNWSTSSQPGPVTEYPPYDPPPVILAPRSR
jgi:hypothetical protein